MNPSPSTPRAKRSQKAASPAGETKQTPIGITPQEGEALGKCSARIGLTVPDFVRKLILEGIAKLDDKNLTAIPCPFCDRTDMLEIIGWNHELPDGTEYQGDAMKCNRCAAVASVESWAKRGMRGNLY
jgi:hypothetical protein